MKQRLMRSLLGAPIINHKHLSIKLQERQIEGTIILREPIVNFNNNKRSQNGMDHSLDLTQKLSTHRIERTIHKDKDLRLPMQEKIGKARAIQQIMVLFKFKIKIEKHHRKEVKCKGMVGQINSSSQVPLHMETSCSSVTIFIDFEAHCI